VPARQAFRDGSCRLPVISAWPGVRLPLVPGACTRADLRRDNVRAVAAVPASLADDLNGVVKTLRTTPAGRLRARLSGPFHSRADAGRALARALAIAAQGIEDAGQPAMPQWREPPVLADLAVGDQVRVVAHDFLAVLATAASVVWTPAGRVPRDELVRDVVSSVAEVAGFL
jgi:hypothetical protein